MFMCTSDKFQNNIKKPKDIGQELNYALYNIQNWIQVTADAGPQSGEL